MTTLVLKKKQVEQVTEGINLLESAVDEYGVQQEKVASLKSKLEDAELDLVTLRERVADRGGVFDQSEKTAALKGMTYRLTVGASSNNTKIDDQAALRVLMGEKVYGKLAKVGVTDAKKYLTLAQMELISHIELGKRRWEVKRIN